MMRYSLNAILVLIVALALSACGQSSTPDVDTARSSGVESTIEALPTSTPATPFTPRPTITSVPTPTPQSTPTATPAPTPTSMSGATAENLEERAISMGRAFVSWNWQEFYDYLHPEDKLGCSSQEFEAMMVAAIGSTSRAEFLAEIGANEESDVEVGVPFVDVSGDEGATIVAYYQNGQLLFEDEQPIIWEFVDGQWYSAPEGQSC